MARSQTNLVLMSFCFIFVVGCSSSSPKPEQGSSAVTEQAGNNATVQTEPELSDVLDRLDDLSGQVDDLDGKLDQIDSKVDDNGNKADKALQKADDSEDREKLLLGVGIGIAAWLGIQAVTKGIMTRNAGGSGGESLTAAGLNSTHILEQKQRDAQIQSLQQEHAVVYQGVQNNSNGLAIVHGNSQATRAQVDDMLGRVKVIENNTANCSEAGPF